MAEAGSSKSTTATRRPFEELNVEIQGAALSATKLAAALPSDVSFHRSVDNEYAAALDACSDKALGLANRLLSLLSSADSSKTSRSKGKYKFEDEDDVTDNFRTVAIDALDLSLERAVCFVHYISLYRLPDPKCLGHLPRQAPRTFKTSCSRNKPETDCKESSRSMFPIIT